MSRTLITLGLVGFAHLIASPVIAQNRGSEKGGQDPFGPYEPVPG